MKTQHAICKYWVTIAAVMWVALLVTPAVAQEKPASRADVNERGAPAKQGSPLEGIKVHGHWSIVIKNPDGSVASRHEFENALVLTETALGDILGRATVIGRWNVAVVAAACVSQDGVGTPVVCDLEEPGGGNCPAASCQSFNNLTVSTANGKAILQGNATATFAAPISTVTTFVSECPRTGTGNYGLPAVCGNTPASNASVFSSTNPTPTISVLAGQIIQVTVTFSFS